MTFRAPVRDLAFALTAVGHDALLKRALPGCPCPGSAADRRLGLG